MPFIIYLHHQAGLPRFCSSREQYDQNYIAYNIYDLDCDGLIGLPDLGVMVENWLVIGQGIAGDFDVDENVNFVDFAEFGIVWGDE